MTSYYKLSKIGPEVVGLVKFGLVDKILIVEPPLLVDDVRGGEVVGEDDDGFFTFI